jgi:uncharacterized protein YegP (UPF0339 family)
MEFRSSYIQIWGILMPKAIFEIFKDKNAKFRFRLKAPNNEVIATGEAYESKQSCLKGIESVKKNAADAEVKDMS